MARFTQGHIAHHLVHYEQRLEIREAIRREKRLKQWKRKWKLALIEIQNPKWLDLYPEITGSRDRVAG